MIPNRGNCGKPTSISASRNVRTAGTATYLMGTATYPMWSGCGRRATTLSDGSAGAREQKPTVTLLWLP